MTDELIKTRLENGVFVLTFNRPDSMNAMSTAMGNRVADALRLAEERSIEIRTIMAETSTSASTTLREQFDTIRGDADREIEPTIREPFAFWSD